MQQFNTLSLLVGGRVALNLVAGSSSAEQHGYGDFLHYKSIGVTQFIISGCPELDEIATFGREIVPLVRHAEAGRTD